MTSIHAGNVNWKEFFPAELIRGSLLLVTATAECGNGELTSRRFPRFPTERFRKHHNRKTLVFRFERSYGRQGRIKAKYQVRHGATHARGVTAACEHLIANPWYGHANCGTAHWQAIRVRAFQWYPLALR
jgi:hypothetical protein